MLSLLGSLARDGAEGRIWEGGVTGTVLPRGLAGILFGTGGVGIFQWFTGFRGDLFSLSSPKVGEDLELNQVLARLAPSLSMAEGCLRRKSVLAPFCIGIGSEMPVMVPSAVRPRLYEFEYLVEAQEEPFDPGRSS